MAINKIFLMAPIFLLMRKLDVEDPNTIFYIRTAYGVIQTICTLIVVYTYIQASTLAGNTKDKKTNQLIYIPPLPAPFEDPNAASSGKKYTEAKYGAHVYSTARSLLLSTLFGICMTVGLHIYRNMITGMAIQIFMGPFNLMDNAVVKALLLGNGFRLEDKIFDEKQLHELKDDDEIQDENGNLLERRPTISSSSNAISSNSTTASSSVASNSVSSSLEDVMLDVWDMGANADITHLMSILTKENCNFQTKKDGWTPIMLLAGLGAQVKGIPSAIRQVRDELGANPGITDGDGWNALHWAAFHGSLDAARELSKAKGDAQILLTVKDKEGYTPAETARKEGNEKIAKLYEEALESPTGAATTTKTETTETTETDGDGIRKRK